MPNIVICFGVKEIAKRNEKENYLYTLFLVWHKSKKEKKIMITLLFGCIDDNEYTEATLLLCIIRTLRTLESFIIQKSHINCTHIAAEKKWKREGDDYLHWIYLCLRCVKFTFNIVKMCVYYVCSAIRKNYFTHERFNFAYRLFGQFKIQCYSLVFRLNSSMVKMAFNCMSIYECVISRNAIYSEIWIMFF